MSANKLKLLPYYHENYDSIAKEAEETGNYVYNNWWYLHGKLEDILHYDKASIINAKECPEFIKMVPEAEKLGGDGTIWTGRVKSFKFIPWLYLNDIVECEVLGIEEPCVGYFWTTDELAMTITSESGECFDDHHWFQRGLICLKSDIESCEYALKKFTEKETFL